MKRITSLRALELLRELERADRTPSTYLLDRVRKALADHVAAGLRRPKRRARRKAAQKV